MRILFVSDVYFPRVNGVSTSIRTFRRELERLGHRIHLIAPDYGQQEPDEEWIIRVPSRQVPFDPEDRFMRAGAVAALKQRLAGMEFDLLHIHTPFVAHYAGVRLAKALGLPCLLTYHTYFEEYLHHYAPFLPRALLRPLVRRLSRHQCGQVDAAVVPSESFRRVLRTYGVEGALPVIPTGIDTERFHSTPEGRSAFRFSLGIPPERPVLGFVGRLAHEKNIDFLLRVVARVAEEIPEVLFLLAGEGPAERHLRALGEQLGIGGNLIFLGNLRALQELCDCYAAADLFIFASRTETQGLVLLEANALGVPVVSTAHLGTADTLAKGLGGVVAPDQERVFAAEVVALLRDPQRRHQLGEEGRRQVRDQWSAPVMAQQLAALYHSLLSETASRATMVEMGTGTPSGSLD